MPISVRTFANSGEAAAALSADRSARYLGGGTLVMRRNILEKGPQSDNPGAAIVMGDEGATNVTHEILIEDNTFTNRMGRPTLFVRNLTATVAVLQGNRLAGDVHPLAGPGTHRPSAKTRK